MTDVTERLSCREESGKTSFKSELCNQCTNSPIMRVHTHTHTHTIKIIKIKRFDSDRREQSQEGRTVDRNLVLKTVEPYQIQKCERNSIQGNETDYRELLMQYYARVGNFEGALVHTYASIVQPHLELEPFSQPHPPGPLQQLLACCEEYSWRPSNVSARK